MIRAGLFLVATLVTAARLTAVPLPPEVRPAVLDMEGTAWAGMGPEDFIIYHFDKGGALSYTDPRSGQRTFRHGFWNQQGANVSFEVNGGSFEFKGTVNDNELDGEGRKLGGHKWEMRLKRQMPGGK